MKNIILFVALLALFAGCEPAPQQETPVVSITPEPDPVSEEPPTLFTSWQAVHLYYICTIDGWCPEEVRQNLEKEISADVEEEDAYCLAFNEDGTGSGSMIMPDDVYRYYFDFTWEYVPSDFESEYLVGSNHFSEKFNMSLSENVMSNILCRGVGDSFIFAMYDNRLVFDAVEWKIEELTTDKLVMSQAVYSYCDGQDENGNWIAWYITMIQRYTFKKVE